MAFTASCLSVLPHCQPPAAQAPNVIAEISKSLLPNFRYSIDIFFSFDIYVRFLCAKDKNISEKMNSQDRKSTRLNSSHVKISYAVFCLKKKKMKVREFFLVSSILL